MNNHERGAPESYKRSKPSWILAEIFLTPHNLKRIISWYATQILQKIYARKCVFVLKYDLIAVEIMETGYMFAPVLWHFKLLFFVILTPERD